MKLSYSIFAAAVVFAAAPAFAVESKPAAAAMQHSDHCGLPMGEGSVTALDVRASKATINHAPIAALGWDAMTMDFKSAKGVDLSAFAVGDRVHFLLAEDTRSKSYRIEAMCALDVSQGLHEACMGRMHETAMARAESSGKSCKTDGMDHGAMKGMDHGSMDGMKRGDTKPADAEAMNCKVQCPMMQKSGAPPAGEKPAPAQDHSQH